MKKKKIGKFGDKQNKVRTAMYRTYSIVDTVYGKTIRTLLIIAEY